MSSPTPSPWRWPLSLWLLLAVMLGAWCHAVAVGLPAFLDSQDYLAQGRNLWWFAYPSAQTWQVPFDPTWLSRRPPGYGGLLGLAMAALPVGTAIPAVLLLQVAVAWGGVAWACRTVAAVGVGRRWWGVPAWLALATPAQWVYPVSIMSESLLQGCLVVAVAAWSHACRTGRPLGRWVAGLALAASLWVKPVMVAVGVVSLAAVVGSRARREASRWAGWLPVVSLVGLLAFNARITGYPHVGSLPAFNALHWNARLVLAAHEPAAAVNGRLAAVESEVAAADGVAAKLLIRRAQALAILAAHPLTTCQQAMRGWLTFFADPGRFDLAAFWRDDTTGASLLDRRVRRGFAAVGASLWQQPAGRFIVLLTALGANLAALAGLVLAVWRGYWRHPAVMASLLLVAYVCLVTGPLGAARFRMPVLPLLAVVATAGLAGAGGKAVGGLHAGPTARYAWTPDRARRGDGHGHWPGGQIE